jgi:hypothetical protein
MLGEYKIRKHDINSITKFLLEKYEKKNPRNPKPNARLESIAQGKFDSLFPLYNPICYL